MKIRVVNILFAVCFSCVGFLAPYLNQASASDTVQINVGFRGLPLTYKRMLDYEMPLPQKSGVFIDRVADNSPPSKAGLRTKNIIHSIKNQTVHSMADIKKILSANRGSTIPLTVYQISPRYAKKLREDPFFDPKRSKTNMYSETTIEISYAPPKPKNLTVVQGPDKRFYHKTTLEHSPNPGRFPTYENTDDAKSNDLKPCPICFQTEDSLNLEKIWEKSIDDSNKLVKNLSEKYNTVSSLPDTLKSLTNRLSKYRINSANEISVKLLKTEKIYGFGLPNGTILISHGLLNLMEGPDERAALIGHLMAHHDRRHSHSPVRQQQIRSLVEEAIKRTTGISFTFDELKSWSPTIPGFPYYRELIEQGYSENNEREAIFLGMTYMYRSEYELGGMEGWIEKHRDMQNEVSPKWLDHLLVHPLPGDIKRDMKKWRQLISNEFPGPEIQ